MTGYINVLMEMTIHKFNDRPQGTKVGPQEKIIKNVPFRGSLFKRKIDSFRHKVEVKTFIKRPIS